MAQQNQNFRTTVPDTSTKVGDKTEETDCNTDSGFISSENIIYYSGDIPEDNIPSSSQHKEQDSNKLQSVETLDSGIVEDKDPSMHLDSGICEVLKIESLSLGNEKLNNLNQSRSSCMETSRTQTVSQKSVPEKKIIHNIPYRYFQQNEDGDTTLHSAILTGHTALCSALIRIAPHPKILDIANDDAQTPLHFAVETQQWQIVRQLILAGAQPNLRDIRGDSPLHIAARQGDQNSIAAILSNVKPQEFQAFSIRYPAQGYEKANLDQWNYSGQTPAHVAAIHGHADVLRQLVNYGADINAKEGLSGFTPLHYAVEAKNEKMVHYLLIECPFILPNTRSYAGRTAWQTCPTVSDKMKKLFKTTGIESPYTTEDEDSDSDEEMYDPKMQTFVSSLVSLSA